MDQSEVRCLTIQQPYGEWIISGLKRVENRSWSTDYRGPLLIHAAAKKVHTDKRTLEEANGMGQSLDDLTDLPVSSIIGCVQFAGVIARVREDGRVRGPGEFEEELQKCLKPFGEKLDRDLLDQQSDLHYDYGIEYWWIFAKPQRFQEPIPCKGALRLWKPPTEALEQLDALIG